MKILKFKGSKSLINRVLTISFFLKEPLKLHNINMCEDVKTMVENLSKLGMRFEVKNDIMTIYPPYKFPENADLFVQDAGTAMRFLTVLLASFPTGSFTIDASEQLRKRPQQPLLDVLGEMGTEIDSPAFPIKLSSHGLKGGNITMPSSVSSQFVSALMLCAPMYKEDLQIELPGEVVSRKYIELTNQVMKDFGVKVFFEKNFVRIAKGQKYCNVTDYFVEPDFSSASYFWALAALSDKPVCTINTASSQPDKEFINVLKTIGADVMISENEISIKRNKLSGITADMKNMPDQVPTLAVLALLLDSETVIKNVKHLKYKESDRISAIVTEITKMGGNIKYDDGNLIIQPLSTKPINCEIETYNDHRIVMAFSMLQVVFPYLRLSSVIPMAKSYPGFISDLTEISLILDIKNPHIN